MNEILSKSELIDLSGYKTNKYIIKWLSKNHIPYILSGQGLPQVNRQALAHIMGAPVDNPNKRIEIDFNQKGFKI